MISGLTIRMKKPATFPWADEADLAHISTRIAERLAAIEAIRRPGRLFRIASAYHAPSLVRALAMIHSSEQKFGPDNVEKDDIGAASCDR